MLKFTRALLMLCLLGPAALSRAASDDALIIEHGPRDSKKVALTFDACPTSHADEFDRGVIDILIREKVPATLFMSGRWVEKNEATAKELASQPLFEIGNHAYRHPHMMEKDDARALREFKRTQAVIRKVTGKKPKYFRPPFGEVDERVAKIAGQVGLTVIQYDIASGDPDPALSAKRIAAAVVREAKGGSIVVFHMNRNGVHTAEALPEVISGLRQKGFELVTVGEMLGQARNADFGLRNGKAGSKGIVNAETGTRERGDPGEGR